MPREAFSISSDRWSGAICWSGGGFGRVKRRQGSCCCVRHPRTEAEAQEVGSRGAIDLRLHRLVSSRSCRRSSAARRQNRGVREAARCTAGGLDAGWLAGVHAQPEDGKGSSGRTTEGPRPSGVRRTWGRAAGKAAVARCDRGASRNGSSSIGRRQGFFDLGIRDQKQGKAELRPCRIA